MSKRGRAGLRSLRCRRQSSAETLNNISMTAHWSNRRSRVSCLIRLFPAHRGFQRLGQSELRRLCLIRTRLAAAAKRSGRDAAAPGAPGAPRSARLGAR